MALVHRVGWEPRFAAVSPWFWPVAGAAARFESFTAWPSTADFDRMHAELTADKGVGALRFGDNVRRQDKRVDGRVNLDALYDARITKHGEVPSRTQDWHDFFNALCFSTFPRAKRVLHARQYAILQQRIEPDATRLPGARTREQDALTLFDEGGVVIATDRAAHDHLLQIEPAQRHLALQTVVARVAEEPTRVVNAGDGRVSVVPFGHALFEHLIEGLRCPGGCTQVVVISQLDAAHPRLLDAVDRALSEALTDTTRFVNPSQCGGLPLSLL